MASAQGWPANAGTWPSGYTGYSQGGYPAGPYGYSQNPYTYYNPYAYSQAYQQYMAMAAAGPGAPVEDGPLDGAAVAGGGGVGCRWWLTGEYLYGWIKNVNLPTPLVTTGSINDRAPGALGQPNTINLFGNKIDYNDSSGFRINTGLFLDDGRHWSADLGVLWFFPNTLHFQQASDTSGNPLIARPITNVFAGEPGVPSSFLTSRPDSFAGAVNVDSRTTLFGAEANIRYNRCWMDRLHGDVLFGFRYLRLTDSLQISDRLMAAANGTFAVSFLGGGVNPGDILQDVDAFRTVNTFYGGQVGGRLRWDGDTWFVSGFSKLALGATDQTADVNGATARITPGSTLVAGGGVLALPSNSGHFGRTQFGVVSESGLNLGLKVTPHVHLTAGYSFLVWNQVLRAGSQIDPRVNPNQVPTAGGGNGPNFGTVGGPPLPNFPFKGESFWLQAVTAGVTIMY